MCWPHPSYVNTAAQCAASTRAAHASVSLQNLSYKTQVKNFKTLMKHFKMVPTEHKGGLLLRARPCRNAQVAQP